MVPLNYYLVLAAILFAIGAIGTLIRKDAIVIFLCIELMMNSVNLSLITFSKMWGNHTGQMIVFFVMAIAACEAAIGLAIILSLYRTRNTIQVPEINSLKG